MASHCVVNLVTHDGNASKSAMMWTLRITAECTQKYDASISTLRCPDRTSPLGISGIVVASRASGTIATLLTMLLRVGVGGNLGCMLEDARAAATRTRCARLIGAVQGSFIASMLMR